MAVVADSAARRKAVHVERGVAAATEVAVKVIAMAAAGEGGGDAGGVIGGSGDGSGADGGPVVAGALDRPRRLTLTAAAASDGRVQFCCNTVRFTT